MSAEFTISTGVENVPAPTFVEVYARTLATVIPPHCGDTAVFSSDRVPPRTQVHRVDLMEATSSLLADEQGHPSGITVLRSAAVVDQVTPLYASDAPAMISSHLWCSFPIRLKGESADLPVFRSKTGKDGAFEPVFSTRLNWRRPQSGIAVNIAAWMFEDGRYGFDVPWDRSPGIASLLSALLSFRKEFQDRNAGVTISTPGLDLDKRLSGQLALFAERFRA